MTGLSAYAGGDARQANFGGDNYAPIYFGGTPAPAPSLHQLPPGIPDFSGRAADIAEIERTASAARGGLCIVNIFGAPGIGKTALTTHVAHRLVRQFDEIQLHAELGEADGQVPGPAQILQRFVAALDPVTAGIPVSAQELPARYRSLLSGRRCLVVLDNAQSAAQVADLIPGTASSAVLVTSRASLADLQGVVLHHLQLMDCAESLVLLSSVSRRTWPDGQAAEAARALVDQCGCLPLALRIVGAILKKKPHWTLEKAAAVLAGERTRLAKLAEGELDVRGSFGLSYRQLGPDEALAFRLFSLLPLAQFKIRHAASFLQQPEDQAEQLLETLVDAQLLETEDGRYFKFHDLLRLYAQELSQAADDDPSGVRAARFLHELTGEFMEAYTRCLRETTWTLPWAGRPRWPGEQHPDTPVQVGPDTLYVPPRLVPDSRPGNPAGSWQDLLTLHRRALITGGGGTGKTVLANRICYDIALFSRSTAQPYDAGFVVPLRQRSDHGQTLETLIADAVRSRYRLDLPQETAGMLLRDQHAVVIFDGLDEMPPSSRHQTAHDITAFCDRYPSVKVIVTSRPGLPTAVFAAAGFGLYEIAPLTAADITSFAERWQQVAQTPAGGYTPLLEIATSTESRRDWLSTPLVITQLLAMYDRSHVIPQDEIDLYDMTYFILFEGRDTVRGIQRGLPPEALGRLVSYLSYALKTHAGVLGATEHEFQALLQASNEIHPYDIPHLSETLTTLDLPVRRAQGEDESRWSVTRDPFSEYLAARWILYSNTQSDIKLHLKAILETGEFDKGAHFILPLAARLHHSTQQLVKTYLHDLLDQDHARLPVTTRTAITQALASRE